MTEPAHSRAERLLRELGDQVFGYLCALLKSEQLADDAWSQFSEEVFRGAPGIRDVEHERAWAFTVARHAALKQLRTARDAEVPLEVRSDDPRLASPHSAPLFQPTVENALTRARAQLDPDDQTLLILRLERDLSWDEVAEVLSGGPLSGAEKTRAAAALRKRFERLKQTLRDAVQP